MSETKGNQVPQPTSDQMTTSDLVDQLIACESLPKSSDGRDHGVEQMLKLLDKASPRREPGLYAKEESVRKFLDFDTPLTEGRALSLLATVQRRGEFRLPTPELLITIHGYLCSMSERDRMEYNIVPFLQSEMARFLWRCRERAKEAGEMDSDMEYVVIPALEDVDSIQKEVGPSPT